MRAVTDAQAAKKTFPDRDENVNVPTSKLRHIFWTAKIPGGTPGSTHPPLRVGVPPRLPDTCLKRDDPGPRNRAGVASSYRRSAPLS